MMRITTGFCFFVSTLNAAAVAAVSSAEKWEPIRCPEADRSVRDRFDEVRVLEDFEAGVGDWKIKRGGQQALCNADVTDAVRHSGRRALRVDYAFAGKPQYEYAEFGPGLDISEPGLGIGFWFRNQGTALQLRLRVQDNSGETHQISLPQKKSDDWQYTAVMLRDQPEAWGGDGNRRLDYPCRLYSIVGDRPHRGYAGKGTLWIDRVALVEPAQSKRSLAIKVAPKRLGNVYEPGETIRLRARGTGDTIRWEVRDFWENVVVRGQAPAAQTELAFIPDKQGFYETRLELLAGGETADARSFRCAVLPKPDPDRPNGFVGVGCHFRGLAYPIACADLLVRYGWSEFRDEISWRNVEPKPGTYVMPDYGREFTARAAQLGLKPLLIFDYGHPAYDDGGFPNSDEAVAAYAAYCSELAKMLKGQVDTFEVWNEWSVGCGMRGKPGKNTPEHYARMLQAAYRAVKSVDPDITIVGIGGEHSEHHFENIRRMIEAGAARSMDVLSVHSYRYPRSPEETDLVGEIKRVADMAQREGAPPRIWVTEIGWPTHVDSRGVDEDGQARYFVRTMALLQSTGVVEKVHWYDFRDDGLNRLYNEHNFGIVRHQRFNYAPKPAAVAAAVFAHLTAGAKPTRYWQQDGRHAVFYKLPATGELAIAWSTAGASRVRCDGRNLKARDMMGNPLSTGSQVTLDGNPVYLMGEELQVRTTSD